jgi:cell division septal protein FtsQ
LVLALLLVAAGMLFWHAARRGDAFAISSVQLPEEPGFTIPAWVMGTNLWELDLRALSEHLKSQQPGLKDVRVTRRPPNRVQIEAVARVPVAQVQVGDWHLVDAEGFILPASDPNGVEGMIRLLGVSAGSPTLRAGTVNHSDRLRVALRAAEMARRRAAARESQITAVDATNPRDLRLTLSDGAEVRCGSIDELETHLSRLDEALQALASRPMSVRSIDVRFDEPLIEPAT